MRQFLIALGAAIVSVLVMPAVSEATPAPSCAEGPQRQGSTVVGTPCSDTIVVGPGVAAVAAGPGDDTIVPGPIPAESAPCPAGCHLGIGSQTFDGGPGDDVVFGERGNDVLEGGEGNDQLFGGIGDDLVRGGPGNDRLSGGFGADAVDGEGGDDYVRGDGTVDTIVDSGGGADTLSYGAGITPGFPNGNATNGYPDFGAYPGLPPAGGERGVYLNLGAGVGDNGVAPFGGGVDKVQGTDFETILGTGFADVIVGTSAAQTIYGAGGGDVIEGGGGTDQIHGGAGGDRCTAGSDCETSSGAVVQRDPTKVAVGAIAPAAASPYTQLYLTGSSGADDVVATYSAAAVTFTLAAGSFDTAASEGCGAPSGNQVTCSLATPLDSLTMSGLGGGDELRAEGFPDRVSVILSGGDGGDTAVGGPAGEDVLVDGQGDEDDDLSGLGGDDALLHNGGADAIAGGDGNDLFLSNSICDENSIDGGAGRDNASWARFGEGVGANVGAGVAGRPGPGSLPACPGGTLDGFTSVEDLEGGNSPDVFYGGPDANQLLGHAGDDVYHAEGGADRILANSGDTDSVIDCGGDPGDVAIVDIPQPTYADAAPVGCERVVEAVPNSFKIDTELPPEALPPQPPPPVLDRIAPRTRITRRPPRRLVSAKPTRRVVFAFSSDEPGSSFRCRIDGKPFRSCRSPRAYVVRRGAHAVRIFAVDRAGNADRSPAAYRFTVRPRRRP